MNASNSTKVTCSHLINKQTPGESDPTRSAGEIRYEIFCAFRHEAVKASVEQHTLLSLHTLEKRPTEALDCYSVTYTSGKNNDSGQAGPCSYSQVPEQRCLGQWSRRANIIYIYSPCSNTSAIVVILQWPQIIRPSTARAYGCR